MAQIDPARPVYLYVQVADAIEADVKAGRLKADTKLPGELEMMETYGVAQGTVRRALIELRERGVVVTLPAKGTYVVGPASS